jgi:hypothetical protein
MAVTAPDYLGAGNFGDPVRLLALLARFWWINPRTAGPATRRAGINRS